MSGPQFSLGFRRPPPVIKFTLIVLVAAFFVAVIGRWASSDVAALLHQLTFTTGDVAAKPWSLLTYPLVQPLNSPWEIIFSGLTIYWFGPDLEARWGKGKLLAFMASAALGGSLFTLLLSTLGLFGGAMGPQAICVAMVVAWGLFNRDRQVYFFFFAMKGIHLVLLTIGMEVMIALIYGLMLAAPSFGGILVGGLWTGFATGQLRQAYLKRKLKKLEAERDAVVAGARKKAATSGLRVISGGRDDNDKRYLN